MTDDTNPSARLLAWLATTDVLPRERASMAAYFHSNGAANLSEERWGELLDERRKREPRLFREPAYSPEARAQILAKMTAAERLEFIERHGGK